MADHVHYVESGDSGMSAVAMVVMVVAVLAIGIFLFLALNGRLGLGGSASPDNDIDVQGTIDLPEGNAQ